MIAQTQTRHSSLSDLLAATKIAQFQTPVPMPTVKPTLPGRRVCLRCRIEYQPRCALCASWINAKYPSEARLKYSSKDRSYLEFLGR